MAASDRVVRVAAGILIDGRGRVLLARRPPEKALAGAWEFPGGKLEPEETPEQALVRELREELGVEAGEIESFTCLRHRYRDKLVELHFHTVRSCSGTPRALEGQELAWVPARELNRWDILEADWPVVSALRLPRLYLVTPQPETDRDVFLSRLAQAIAAGVGLVQFRAPALAAQEYAAMLPTAVDLCARAGAELIVHGAPELAVRHGAAGVHLTARQLMACDRRPLAREYCVGASCHSAAEVEQADALGLDYVTIGSVRATLSHPDQAGALGLDGFATLAARTSLPAFAIGGMTAEDLGAVRESGGHGIAAIRSLWSRQDG